MRQIRDEFWVDLINEAKLAKYAMEAVWDERWINLLEAIVWDLWGKVWAVKKTAQIVYNPKKVWLDLAWKNLNKWFENKIKVPNKEDLEKFKVKNWDNKIKVPNKWKITPSVSFKEWLEKLSKWELEPNKTLSLEREWVLKDLFWEWSYTLWQRRLKDKMFQHKLSFEEIKNLDKEINSPILVYDGWDKFKSRVIVTNINKWENKIALAVWLDRKKISEIDEVKSIHPKELKRLINETSSWKVIKVHFENTKKIQD